MNYKTHKLYNESHWVSRLRENLTSGSEGEGLETGHLAPRQSFTRQLFFKWIKQHLKIKVFYGNSQNAVFSQIWIAVCTYLLLAIAKKRWHLEETLYTVSQVLEFCIFDKIPINELFNDRNKYYFNDKNDNQLNLFSL
jgi:hypothetical protein